SGPDWIVPPPAGWGDPWAGAGHLPPPPPPPPASRPGQGPGAVVVGILVALVIGFVGAGLVLHRTDTTTSSSSSPFDTTPLPGGSATSPSLTPAGGTGSGSNTSTTPVDLSSITAKVDPAVVNITTTLGSSGSAAGTGMVLTANGEVMTNNHVIDGATSISAQVNGTGPTYKATLLGTDPTDDVALIQLQGASGLKTVAPASSTVSVGDQIVAIGNALGRGGTPATATGSVVALDQSVTAGDPTAGTAENLTGMIQIDATLQPGDSGGPLVNANGQVVGMDTAAAVSRGRLRSGSSVGFAIPIQKALGVVGQIRSGKASATIEIGQPGFLGVQVTTVDNAASSTALGGASYTPPAGAGAVIVGVVPNAPADNAGVAVGDMIVSVDGKTVGSPSDLTPILHAHHPGDTVQLGWVDRAGHSHSAKVKLSTAPAG
ncbi:MAG: S1C family serine protease, partial [Acidimicrobiales bacterium]